MRPLGRTARWSTRRRSRRRQAPAMCTTRTCRCVPFPRRSEACYGRTQRIRGSACGRLLQHQTSTRTQTRAATRTRTRTGRNQRRSDGDGDGDGVDSPARPRASGFRGTVRRLVFRRAPLFLNQAHTHFPFGHTRVARPCSAARSCPACAVAACDYFDVVLAARGGGEAERGLLCCARGAPACPFPVCRTRGPCYAACRAGPCASKLLLPLLPFALQL